MASTAREHRRCFNRGMLQCREMVNGIKIDYSKGMTGEMEEMYRSESTNVFKIP